MSRLTWPAVVAIVLCSPWLESARAGGQAPPSNSSATARGAVLGTGTFTADPNNFFLTSFAPCDGCTSRVPTPAR